MWQKIGSGELKDLPYIGDYEESIAEGDNVFLKLNLTETPSQDVADTLQGLLALKGVPAVAVKATPQALDVYYQKGFPWLAVIAAVVIGLIILAVTLVSWDLFREVKEVVPGPIISAGLIVAIVIGLGIALLLFIRR